MMNEEVIHGLVNDAMVIGGFLGMAFTIAVGVFVTLVNSSRQDRADRMFKLEDEVLKLKQFKASYDQELVELNQILNQELVELRRSFNQRYAEMESK